MLMLVGAPASIVANQPNDEADVVEISGRVVDPQGNAVAAAEVFLLSSSELVGPSVQSGTDGSFVVDFRKSSLPAPFPNPDRWKWVSLVAKAPGFVPTWAEVGQLEPGAEVSLQLVRDDVPIQGRILSLDGRPIAGARLEVSLVSRPLNGSLDDFLRAFRDRPVQNTWVEYRVQKMASAPASAILNPDEIRTDDQGRFELHGIGGERLLKCEVKGRDIETTTFLVVTRPQVPPAPPQPREAIPPFETPIPVYAASFNHFVGPSRPITGTVKAKDSGQPIAGARLRVYYASVMHTAEADATGEYSLEGLPIKGEFHIDVTPPSGEPYLPANRSMVATGALKNLQADFELVRGVLVKGRLLNVETDEPVEGYVEYLVYGDNHFYQQLPAGFGSHRADTTGDGRFELVVMPGPGALAALGAAHGAFCFARPEEFEQPADEQGMISTANRGLVLAKFFNRVIPINPDEGSDPLTHTFTLRPAQQVTLKLVDGDGRPVISGVLGNSLSGHAMHPVRGGSYDVPSLEPDETRTAIFVHRERNIGAGLAASGADPGTHTVTLRPCATLTGRLVDAEGRPVTNALVFVWVEPTLVLSHTGGRTDVDGRFHMTGVVPGVTCRLLYRPKPGDTFELTRLSLRSGEKRDLGDLDVSKASRE